jgi:hypothetical protein
MALVNVCALKHVGESTETEKEREERKRKKGGFQL